MDDIGLLVKSLIREQAYDLIVKNRKYIDFANLVLSDNHSTKALQALLLCVDSINRCPEDIKTLIHFVKSNRRNIPEFEKSELFDQQLLEISQDEDSEEIGSSVLIDNVYNKAYTEKLSDIYIQAGKIAAGGQKNTTTKTSGPAAADEYIKEEKQRLVTKSPPGVGGDLVENLDYIEDYIDSFIRGDAKRVWTGIKKIDEITLIGRGQRNRWIGIMGYTHHGKSLMLMTMLYHMACHGANVLLIPRETSVEEAWMTLVWLHHRRVCPDRPIADRATWMRSGASVGKENYDTIKMILKDLREGSTIPGKLIVEPCKSWEEIEEYVKTTNNKVNYDVLGIDYFAHLDTDGGNKRDSDTDKYKKALRRAQMLTLDGIENDKSGLVVITPLQVNRKGYEEAAKQENDLYGVYQNLNAVEYFTQAAQDMDCVMSVWFEGDSCKNVSPQQMIVHCLKGRGNMIFPTHRLAIHEGTGMLYELTSDNAPVDRDRTADSIGNIADVLYTKTSINSDEWGT